MFFTHDHPFEEFYCICIILLNKTWKEMRATIEDFTKVNDRLISSSFSTARFNYNGVSILLQVFSVVREQIVRSLQSQPLNFEKLKQKLQTLTYNEITNLWQQERTTREEWESHAKPIVQLKELITPEIVDLIQKQRLGYLIEGTRFTVTLH
jgi:engulfment/cell motility protein 1